MLYYGSVNKKVLCWYCGLLDRERQYHCYCWSYVQASYIVSEQSTRDREFGPLEKIRDNHPKYVISATPLLTQRDENGITHLSLRKFLKEGLWCVSVFAWLNSTVEFCSEGAADVVPYAEDGTGDGGQGVGGKMEYG